LAYDVNSWLLIYKSNDNYVKCYPVRSNIKKPGGFPPKPPGKLSFDKDGELNYFVTRAYDNNWRKYLNPPSKKDIIFNRLYLDFSKDMVLVEGVFDAVTAGDNSVPLLGSTLTERSKLFYEIVKNDTPIYLALDPDAKRKADKIIKLLLKYDVQIHTINVAPYKDVGEMTKKEFLARKHSAEVLTLDDYLLSRIKGI